MSILIKGAEMPKESWECPCHNGETGRCKVTGYSCLDIPKDCPLIETPLVRHGHWVDDTFEDGEWYHTCSVCGIFVEDKYAGQWCSNCGNLLTNGENNE